MSIENIPERDHRLDAGEALDRLFGSLPVRLDLRQIGTSSLVPAKVAVLREVLTYRAAALGRDSLSMIDAGRMVSASTLVRSCLETVAGLVCLGRRVARAITENSASGLNDFVVTLLLGSKDDTTDVPARNVLTLIQEADREWPGLIGEYSAFSEFAHPNYAGGLASFAHTDWKGGIVRLSAADHQLPPDALTPLLAGIADIAIHEYETLRAKEPQFCLVCDAEAEQG